MKMLFNSREALAVALFMALLWLPMIRMAVSSQPATAGAENRTLADKPELLRRPGIGAVLKFRREFEKYFNDNFGFRNELVRLNGAAHIRLAGISPTQRVIVGKDDWLFYDDPNDGVSLKDFRGEASFTKEELRRIGDKFAAINDRLNAGNISFMVVIAPNKHTVYPEKLPSSSLTRRGRITRADQVREALIAAGIDVVDLRDKLLSGKGRYPFPLYLLTDTHWNSLGAFLGYEEIMTRIGNRHPVVAPMQLDDFAMNSHANGGTGDLAGFINVKGLMRDTVMSLKPQTALRAKSVKVDYESMTGRKSVASEVDDPRLPRLIMFRDSFADALIPYLSENFSRSVYIWKPVIDFSVIGREQPDIVIYEVVERYLGSLL
ncbi:MAG: hypothetical protein HZA20_11730 [Nitrospirae bacterium]|nr:hypothetical protein [Nitrospirota bacterium]